MKLIIAEKPSVAKNIAAVVGAVQNGRYMEGGGYLITSCVGHLCSLAMPDAYDPKYKLWSMESLPIIPQAYQFVVQEQTKSQFHLIAKLMADSRVDSIINACDGDREGENIFRLVYQKSGCTKPVERLWISSMEPPAIQKGLENLRPMSSYDHLADAALCRLIADWLLGINASRLYTCRYHTTLRIGRVQTPLVNLVVQREQDVQSFVPRAYWMVSADLGGFTVSCQCETEDEAEQVQAAIAGASGVVSQVTSDERREAPPELYNLTDLQIDANRLLGASAAQTLNALQQLYESSYATYPRTDSKYLTEQDRTMAEALIQRLKDADLIAPEVKAHLQTALDVVVNDKKVEGHPALLPTVSGIAQLAQQHTLERSLLTMLCYRLLEAVSPARELTTVKAEIVIAGYSFSVTGTVEQCKGWKLAEEVKRKQLGLKSADREEAVLPDLQEQQSFSVLSVHVEQKQTKPPQRYTEATLLDKMKKCGLGTPATRAAILEKMIWTKANPNGLITRGDANGKDSKHLYPTQRAVPLMQLLPDAVTSAETTAEWECQLTEIAEGKRTSETFLDDMAQYIRRLVEDVQVSYTPEDTTSLPPRQPKEPICACPVCGGTVVPFRYTRKKDGTPLEAPKTGFRCTTRDCAMHSPNPIYGRELTKKEVCQLLTKGQTALLDGFISKAGAVFSGVLELERDTEGKPTGRVQFRKETPLTLCACPICGKPVVSFHYNASSSKPAADGYQCSDKNCKLKRFYNPRSGRQFSDEELKALYETGQTAMLSGFSSQAGKPFRAAVALKQDGAGERTGEYTYLFQPRKCA